MTRLLRPWTRIAPVSLAVLMAVVPCGAQQGAFRARVDVVRVDVLVKSGNVPVTGLTGADFEVQDNGVVQQVDALRAEDVPVDLTLVLDVSGSTRSLVDGFKSDIRRIASLLRPDDRVRLIAFAGEPVQVFGFQPGSAPLSLNLDGFAGASAVDDSLLLALAWLPAAGRRHLIAAFTDGQDNASIVDRVALTAAAARAPAVLNIVVPPIRMTRNNRTQAGVQYRPSLSAQAMRPVAEATGGSVVVSDSATQIHESFKLMFETFRSGYVLQYTPKGVNAEGWHELTVTVKQPGAFEIHARKGYAGS